jgi:outer membrane protein assembly factor BamD
LAQVRLADVYFLQESFNEAAVAYETFRDLHPKHELVPYALFRTGRSYFRDAPTEIARDLGPASRAVEAYREFLKRFPNHSLSEDAHKELDEALELLARKENYIAQFYRREGQVKAAKARLEFLVATYPETATAKEARKTLQELSAP